MEGQRPAFGKDRAGLTTNEDLGELDISRPPPYSGQYNARSEGNSSHPASVSPNIVGFPCYPGLPRVDYRAYSPPLSKLSSDLTTLVTKAEYLSANVDALVSFIRLQASVPPKLQIRVRGTRGRKVDFDIRLNLMSLLVPDDAQSRMDYLRCAGQGELTHRGAGKPSVFPVVPDGDLEEWCRRFVREPASVKSFALDRAVSNLDTEWLEGLIRSLVASLNYHGMVQVSFPVSHSRVVIQSPDIIHPFITNVATLFMGKNKYEVVKAIWPFADRPRGESGRRCAVQAEDAWWKEWQGSLKHAISNKRHGWVTVEDRFEALMEGKGNECLGPIEWGPDV